MGYYVIQKRMRLVGILLLMSIRCIKHVTILLYPEKDRDREK